MTSGGYFLRLRSYPGRDVVTAHVLTRHGTAVAGLLWGELLPAVAEDLATALDLVVEREECPLDCGAPYVPPGCAPLAQQKELFG